MLARIRNSPLFRATNLVLLLGAACALTSCATKEPQLIADGSERETALPWNQKQKWEDTGQLGGFADRLQTR